MQTKQDEQQDAQGERNPMGELGLAMKDLPPAQRQHVIELCAEFTGRLVDAVLNEPGERRLRWENAAFAAGMAVNGLISILRMASEQQGATPPSKAEFVSRFGEIMAVAVAHEIAMIDVDELVTPDVPDTRH